MVFGEISFDVDIEPFVEWSTEARSRFTEMVKTMVSIAHMIELRTIPLVPLDTSNLEQSFTYQIIDSSQFIAMAVGYDAVDEKSGFHYAQYQHDVVSNFSHPKRGRRFYLRKGINRSKNFILETIETDYMSLFTGGKMTSSGIGINDSASGWDYTPTYVKFEWDDM